MLKRILVGVIPALILTTAAAAASLEDGWAAYERGDYAMALRVMLPFAEQGDAEVQYKLGVMYDKGRGVPKDYAEAVKWYRLAAEQGQPSAQNNLGVMYKNGWGVPQDYVRAYQWFSLAASSFLESEEVNRDRALQNRDSVYARMTPAQLAEAQRLAREWTPKP